MGVLQQPPHGDVLLQKRERDVLNQGERTQGATAREIMMGEGNRVASVILFTFTLKPGPHAHTACVKPPPPC